MPTLRACHAGTVRPMQLVEHTRPHDTPTAAARDLGTCVYVVRTPDRLVKIGFTTDLDRRIRQFGSRWTDVLLAVSADIEYEKALHRRFATYLARGAEYYFPTIEIMQWVNMERALLGAPAA